VANLQYSLHLNIFKKEVQSEVPEPKKVVKDRLDESIEKIAR